MHQDLNEGFRLGELLVRPQRGQVTCHDETRHLSPKAAAVLLCLAARPRQIVSRRELLECGWGDGRGSQEALSHAVRALRTALNDQRGDARFIQTLPRRGYRLLVEPEPIAGQPRGDLAPGDPEQAARPAAAGSAPRRNDFLSELKRRGVIETGLAYLVFGWLLIQVADVTFDQLLLPRWLGTFVTILVISGFPIALVLAWFIDIVEGRAVLDRGQPLKLRNVVSRTYTAVLGALALAAIAVFAFDWLVGLPGDAETTAIGTSDEIALETPVDPLGIAILPFLNIDGSEETAIFAVGLAEDLIGRLTKVPSLKVSSRSDSFSMPPNAGSVEVRKRLRVSYYLEGSVRVLDERLRVVIQLIDSSNGFQLLSRTFDGNRRDFFEIQDQITGLTVSSLRVALPPETRAVPDSLTENENLDAYVLYRRGMDALHRPVTAESIEEALDWFGRSLAVDPEYAAAHAGKCIAYVTGFGVAVNPEFVRLAEHSCASAIGRNPNLDVVHVALGDLYRSTGRLPSAEDAYQRALAINGNNVEALTGLAAVYHQHRRPDLAEEKYRQAIGLQPGNWRTYDDLGTFLFELGRYAEAAENYRRVISVDPENVQGYGKLGAALMLSGDIAGAEPAFKRSLEIQPQRDSYSNLGMMYYYLGRLDEAVVVLEKATEMAPNDHLAWSNLGDVLSFTDETRAQASFRRAERLAESRLAVNPNDADTMIELAWIKAMLGEEEGAAALMAPARRLKPGDPYIRFISGLVEVKSGDTSRGYEDLEAALEMGFPLEMMSVEPHLRALRDEPRFIAMTGGKQSR